MRSPRHLVAVVAVALLSTGCTPSPATDPGPTDSAGASGSSSSAQSKDPTCALVPPSLIKSTLGLDVGQPTSVTNPPVVGCTYTGERSVIVRFQSEEDAASFARGRTGFETSGQPTSDVAGFMDEAYTSSTEFGDTITNTLVARRGSVEILVTAAVPVDAEKALVTQIFAALT